MIIAAEKTKGILCVFAVWLGLLVLSVPSPAQSLDKVFPPDAVINVTLPPYNVRPGPKVDNTTAIQKAITDNVGSGRVLYFPAGTYFISNTLSAKGPDGLWKSMLTLQGAGRDRSILRLFDKSEDFNDKNTPKSLLMTGSGQDKGDSADGGGNKAFRNNIFDLTIDTGSGNPGAIGIEYAVSNQGAIENVAIRTGDGSGVAGISMKRRIPGPGLLKNVTVTNFDYGLDIGDMEYGVTLEDVTLTGQKIAGIRDSENLLHIRHLSTSSNQVPAILVTNPRAMITLVDPTFAGSEHENACAIDCAGSLLVRNVRSIFFRDIIRCRGTVITNFDPFLYVNPTAIGAPASRKPLLPVEETPEYWNYNLSDWIAVGPRNPGEEDDTAAIQRAIDSGKSTVYFPVNRTYFLSDTVIVRGSVRQILGMGSEISLGAAKVPFSDIAHPRPLFRIDPTTSKAVSFEQMFFNAQYPGEVLFENNSPADVTIKHCMGWVGAAGHRHSYRNTTNATGKLFLEDVFLPGWEFTHQRVWARQLNPENPDGDGTEPQVSNLGGKLWILGFKTEGPAPFLSTTSGGITELLGAYNYISATDSPTVPVDSVPYIVTDSTAKLTFLTDNFRDNDYRVYIRETQGHDIHEWKGSDLAPRNSTPHDRSFVVPLYTSKSPAGQQ